MSCDEGVCDLEPMVINEHEVAARVGAGPTVPQRITRANNDSPLHAPEDVGVRGAVRS